MGAPTDWQGQALDAIEKMKTENPAEELHGVLLPEEWKGDLRPFVSNGEVRRILGVKRVAFTKGKSVKRMDPPAEEPPADQ